MENHNAAPLCWWLLGWMARAILLIAAAVALPFGPVPALAIPPEIPGIDRQQSVSNSPQATSLLRIWLIGVGQGDGILIELPPAVSTAVAVSDTDLAGWARYRLGSVLSTLGESENARQIFLDALKTPVSDPLRVALENYVGLMFHDQGRPVSFCIMARKRPTA